MSDQQPQAPVMPSGEFRVGHVLVRAMHVLISDFAIFYTVMVVAFLPSVLLTWTGAIQTQTYFGIPLQTFAGARGATTALLITFGAFPIYLIAHAVIFFGAFQKMRDRAFGLGAALALALKRFFPLLGLSIAYTVAVALGSLLLLVPGLMLLSSFYVSYPACIVEGLGPLTSLSRSSALTKGHRWRIFGIVLLIYLLTTVVATVPRILLQRMMGAEAAIFAGVLFNALVGSYNYVLLTAVYYDLRVLKDGIDVDRIAAVFD